MGTVKKLEKIKLLIIEDEDFDVKRIRNTIANYHNQIILSEVVTNGNDALKTLQNNKNKYDVIIMDYQISGGLIGKELIHRIKSIDPFIQIIVITKRTINQSNVLFANELIDSGAFWYGTKYPSDIEKYIYQPTDFILCIFNAYEKRKLGISKSKSDKFLSSKMELLRQKSAFLGTSKIIKDILDNIQKYASSDASILIAGESGTGKELIASNIHYSSKRKFENYITINCAAIPADLIESELFGFTKGSFSGASEAKPGLFEQANNGTIFLDEVCELPINLQSKLLRVIESGEIDKIGRKKKYKVNVRIVSATNRNIEKLVNEKKFREDLYYRLNTIKIESPPLRFHLEDVPIYVNHFLDYFSNEENVKRPIISDEAVDLLAQYKWPGNVRQLKNVIHRLIVTNLDTIMVDDINNMMNNETDYIEKSMIQFGKSSNIVPWKNMEKKFRKQYFTYVRNNSSSDREAAKKLKIAPPNFHRMCKDLGLK